MPTSNRFVVNEATWDQAVLDLRRAKARISTYLEAVGRTVDVLRATELTETLRPDLSRLVEYLDECEDAEAELGNAVNRLRFVVDNDATAKDRGDDSPSRPLD
jgi:hypothetical protein